LEGQFRALNRWSANCQLVEPLVTVQLKQPKIIRIFLSVIQARSDFAVGDRSGYMADCFIEDLASRLSHRVQLSSDALRAYTDAVERAFGAGVNYGSIVQTFSHSDLEEQRRYSPPEVMNVKRIPVAGNPVVDLLSTSHVEKQNHTLRMHCRRLT